jgi:hypothetical protein
MGTDKFYAAVNSDWRKFVEHAHTHGWCDLVHLNGHQQVSALYGDMIKGHAAPSKGFICSLN